MVPFNRFLLGVLVSASVLLTGCVSAPGQFPREFAREFDRTPSIENPEFVGNTIYHYLDSLTAPTRIYVEVQPGEEFLRSWAMREFSFEGIDFVAAHEAATHVLIVEQTVEEEGRSVTGGGYAFRFERWTTVDVVERDSMTVANRTIFHERDITFRGETKTFVWRIEEV